MRLLAGAALVIVGLLAIALTYLAYVAGAMGGFAPLFFLVGLAAIVAGAYVVRPTAGVVALLLAGILLIVAGAAAWVLDMAYGQDYSIFGATAASIRLPLLFVGAASLVAGLAVAMRHGRASTR